MGKSNFINFFSDELLRYTLIQEILQGLEFNLFMCIFQDISSVI